MSKLYFRLIITLISISGLSFHLDAQSLPFPQSSDVSELHSTTFLFSETRSGDTVINLGDINGDGFSDYAVHNYNSYESYYLVLGKADYPSNVNNDHFSRFRNTNYFNFNKIYGGGDINNDGYDDIVISDKWDNDCNGTLTILYGGPYVPEVITRDNVGLQFKTILADEEDYNDISITRFANHAEIIKDINNDGFDDIIVTENTRGASSICPNEVTNRTDDKSYIIFGKENFPDSQRHISDIEDKVEFHNKRDNRSVDNLKVLGDINADGFDDFVCLMKELNDENNDGHDGYIALLIFGKENWIAGKYDIADLIDKKEAIYLNIKYSDNLEYINFNFSKIGDIDKDGYDDFGITFAFKVVTGFWHERKSIVLYGHKSIGESQIDLKDIKRVQGFEITTDSQFSPLFSNSRGDINDDGYEDILLTDHKGSTFIIYGSSSKYHYPKIVDFGSHSTEANIDGNRAFRIDNSDSDTHHTAGITFLDDFNGDGVNDIVQGAMSDQSKPLFIGRCYVVYGVKDGIIASNDILQTNASTINLFPNPASDLIELNIKNDFLGDIEIEIFTLKGQNVLSFIQRKNNENHQSTIDIRHLLPATYILNVKAEETIFTKKFIKK
ncbi:T9SS type A sorting domain-containing protein [Flammeovirga sp. EKP202]|uniref:T9SS type A sorting domain-containing protein n=1 Tax=Flammeovirga sp. EKP202 TaxID=2770592 RepID=UPI00165FEAC2|nr:T9SS type A sorting domain-containing protein [Flammeovirga sp. EKP202]MBD0402042.1 T9SS type A sorting domain-containing protein [Flammeovirga sp. EKP202]